MKRAPGIAAVVGTFDGLHRGHRFLLEKVKEMAALHGMDTRVYTFSDHPLRVIAPERAPLLLNTLTEKRDKLKEFGINQVEVADFENLRHLTAREFIKKMADEGVRLLVIGHDNRFGCDGLKTLPQFIAAADGLPVEIVQAPQLTDGDKAINSTIIRKMLSEGKVQEAGAMLGYNYRLSGRVVAGKQLGRTIGFPTANIQPEATKIIPAAGVYACIVNVGSRKMPAMVNIGSRPTVDNPGAPLSIEAHIIGLDEDIYGREVTLEFMQRMRDEQKFPDLAALHAQLERDRSQTLALYYGKGRQ